MLKILNNDKFTTAQNRHSLVSLKIPILNTLLVGAFFVAICKCSKNFLYFCTSST